MNRILTVIVIAVLVVIALGALTMWLWNIALVPAIPAIMEIGFWQAIGILVLSGLLFKSPYIRK